MNANWLKVFLLLIVSVSFCQANSGHGKNVSDYNIYDYTGMDFRNTQLKKLCLLARLDASFEISYRSSDVYQNIIIPKKVDNAHSQCDVKFLSILRLEWNGISYQLYFRRDKVDALPGQRTYCDECDSGHWRLEKVELTIDDTSIVNSSFPRTSIDAAVNGSEFSSEAGELTSGVAVDRGYKCSDKTLSAKLFVRKAVDLTTHHDVTEEWNLRVHFYAVEVQPFLVTNENIKDPVLCKDPTLFIIIIISLPLVYFFFFIVIYRVKERYEAQGLSMCYGKMKVDEFDGCDKKLLVKPEISQSSYDRKPVVSSYKANAVSITCTTPDQTKKALL